MSIVMRDGKILWTDNDKIGWADVDPCVCCDEMYVEVCGCIVTGVSLTFSGIGGPYHCELFGTEDTTYNNLNDTYFADVVITSGEQIPGLNGSASFEFWLNSTGEPGDPDDKGVLVYTLEDSPFAIGTTSYSYVYKINGGIYCKSCDYDPETDTYSPNWWAQLRFNIQSFTEYDDDPGVLVFSTFATGYQFFGDWLLSGPSPDCVYPCPGTITFTYADGINNYFDTCGNDPFEGATALFDVSGYPVPEP